jgi:dihydropteroate synthase
MQKEIIFDTLNLRFNKSIIMGILNVTPDSFSDGGLYIDKKKAVMHGIKMISDGADIIDIGGESSQPGSEPISIAEEIKRVLPVVRELSSKINIHISIDTYKPQVAEECIRAGACMINDISGLRDKDMLRVARKYKVPVIIMHIQGTPKTMQENPQYKDVVKEIIVFFKKQIEIAERNGVKDIIIDPGIGFGKTLEHNIEIIRNLKRFKKLNKPILIGVSRKSFLGKITGLKVNERLSATLSAVVICAMNGANIFRVHDVKECKQALMVLDAINS